MTSSSKGMTVPVTGVIVVVLALVVLVAVLLFFVSTSGTQISKTEAQQIFQTKCQIYCDRISSRNNIELSATLSQNDPEFLQACGVLGIEWKTSKGEIPLRCIASCPCDVSVSAGEVRGDINCRASCVRQTTTSEELSSCIAAC